VAVKGLSQLQFHCWPVQSATVPQDKYVINLFKVAMLQVDLNLQPSGYKAQNIHG